MDLRVSARDEGFEISGNGGLAGFLEAGEIGGGLLIEIEEAERFFEGWAIEAIALKGLQGFLKLRPAGAGLGDESIEIEDQRSCLSLISRYSAAASRPRRPGGTMCIRMPETARRERTSASFFQRRWPASLPYRSFTD